MKTITSKDNAGFKAVAKLVASASERRRTGLSVLDGAHLVAAFLDSGRTPEEVFVSTSGAQEPEIAALLQRAAGVRVTVLGDALFDALSTVETPTGILATVRTPQGKPVPDDAPFALLLEEIQDPGNVGTLLRSAAAAGAGHVLLSPHCAFAWSPKVLRAAMGAHFALNIAEGVDLAAWVKAYRGKSVALVARGETPLYRLDLRKPVALVVGNEGAGLSEPLQQAATVRAHIPMAGPMESLNAGAAGAIALFETLRQATP